MDAALLLAALATRAGIESTCSPSIAAHGRRRRTAVADGGPASARRTPWPGSSPNCSRPTSSAWPSRSCGGRDDTRWSCCSRPGRRPGGGGVAPVLGRLTHRHTVLVAAVADGSHRWRGPRRSEAVLRAAAAERDRAGRFRVSRLPSDTAPTSSTRPRTSSRPPSPTPTCRSRPPANSGLHPVDHVHHPGGLFHKGRTLVERSTRLVMHTAPRPQSAAPVRISTVGSRLSLLAAVRVTLRPWTRHSPRSPPRRAASSCDPRPWPPVTPRRDPASATPRQWVAIRRGAYVDRVAAQR